MREVPKDLMTLVISSSEVFVMQTEFSVYVLLRLWLFLIKHPEYEGNATDAVLASHKFFQVGRKRSILYKASKNTIFPLAKSQR